MSVKINRREFLFSLSGIAVLPRVLARMGHRHLPVFALNHMELSVSDPQRSIEFYQGLFGMPIQAHMDGTTILRIGDGPQFMAIRAVARGQAPSISCLGIALSEFDPGKVIETLKASGVRDAGLGMPAETVMRVWTIGRGVEVGGEVTTELFLGDPHGIIVRLVDPTHCGGIGPLGNICGIPEVSPVTGLLSVHDLNHFTINVPDPPSAVRFYQEVFGLPIQAYQASTPALGIGEGTQFLMFSGGTVASRPAVINHVCMTVEAFDTEEILGKLSDYGIRSRVEGESTAVPLRSYISMRMPNRGGVEAGTPELYFTDPDGLRIQLQDTTYCGGGGHLGEVCI